MDKNFNTYFNQLLSDIFGSMPDVMGVNDVFEIFFYNEK